MSSLNDKLDKVLESKEAIKTAVNNKGGNITDDTLLSQYDDIINQLEVLTANMKSDIDSLNNSGASYESKLDTALSSINSYLNTLNSYINPSYSSSSSIATTKLANLNNQFSSQLTNLRNAVVNKGGSVSSPYNLPNITTGINGIQTTTTVVDDTIPSNARTYLQDIDDTNTFNDTGDAYTWANACYSRLRSAYSYLYRAVNNTSSTTYRYPLDDELYSLSQTVYNTGLGGSSSDDTIISMTVGDGTGRLDYSGIGSYRHVLIGTNSGLDYGEVVCCFKINNGSFIAAVNGVGKVSCSSSTNYIYLSSSTYGFANGIIYYILMSNATQ